MKKNFFQKINDYFKESYNELVHKVSWPTVQELSSSTVIVMTASLLMAAVIFLIDLCFESAVTFFCDKIFS
ncbi:MAG: preprotein translocase subunit SecE [Dysgonamonadaceae bacterium]|jgi:preprotein translocase subunit SecE|nr:preprotein translocase subunit SecE [Dysgonamonadaceae bacterium]